MRVESCATPVMTIDEVEKVQRQKIGSFIGHYSKWLMRLRLTNSFDNKSWIAAAVVLFNTRVKLNSLASWWIMMIRGCITTMEWWNKLFWIQCWTLPKVYAMLLFQTWQNVGSVRFRAAKNAVDQYFKMADIILDRQRDYSASVSHYPVALICCNQ